MAEILGVKKSSSRSPLKWLVFSGLSTAAAALLLMFYFYPQYMNQEFLMNSYQRLVHQKASRQLRILPHQQKQFLAWCQTHRFQAKKIKGENLATLIQWQDNLDPQSVLDLTSPLRFLEKDSDQDRQKSEALSMEEADNLEKEFKQNWLVFEISVSE